METIGSRLRKRRRTSPMPNEDSGDSPPPPKRAQSTRGASTRGKRGQAATSQPSTSLIEIRPPVHAAPPEIEPSPPIASPVPAPSIQQPPQEMPTSDDQLPIQEPPAQGAADPTDINSVIAEIINHGETVESHCASQGYAAMGIVDTESYSQLGASLHLKLQSLPILDNLVSCHCSLRTMLFLTNLGHTNHKHFGQILLPRNPHHSYKT